MTKRFFVTLLTGYLAVSSVTAQEITRDMEMQDLVRICYTYRHIPYLSFDISYQYSDSANPSVIREQVNGQYKMHETRFWAMLDSTEFVQGNNYSLAIFREDKIISINKAHNADDKILQLPAPDSLFSSYADSMHVSNLSDNVRVIKIYFKKAMLLSGYEMRYNPHTYLVNSIQYYMRERQGNATDGSSGVNLIKASMSNYSQEVIPEDYFMESKYIYRDSIFYTQPQYKDYQLVLNDNF